MSFIWLLNLFPVLSCLYLTNFCVILFLSLPYLNHSNFLLSISSVSSLSLSILCLFFSILPLFLVFPPFNLIIFMSYLNIVFLVLFHLISWCRFSLYSPWHLSYLTSFWWSHFTILYISLLVSLSLGLISMFSHLISVLFYLTLSLFSLSLILPSHLLSCSFVNFSARACLF